MERLKDLVGGHTRACICALAGVLLLLFPNQIVKLVPWVGGIGLILAACLNLAPGIRNARPDFRPGRSVVLLALGVMLLMLKHESLGVIGVIWAMYILHETAEEVNEAWHAKHIHPLRAIWLAVSVVLAVLLMHDPFEHFVFHMRVLALELIGTAVDHWNARRKNE